jgi:hypothetical protein
MPDVKFVWKGVKHTSLAYAAKKAVLWPLTRRRALRNKAVVKDLKWLQRFWREQLCVLRDAGWKDLATPGKVQFCRNCPPTIGVAVGEKPCRPCNMRQICPWCYARQIGVLYDALAELLPNRGKLSEPIRLLEIKNKVVMPLKDVGKMVNPTLKSFKKSPTDLLKRLAPLGAYYNVHLEPKSVHGHYSAWKFSYSVVALVPLGWEQPEWLAANGRKIRVTDVYSKQQLVNVIARICRYPVGLLKGDPKLAMISLNARRGTRSSAMLGCFRNKRTVESATT